MAPSPAMSLRGIIAKGESVRLLPQIAAALLAAAPVPVTVTVLALNSVADVRA